VNSSIVNNMSANNTGNNLQNTITIHNQGEVF